MGKEVALEGSECGRAPTPAGNPVAGSMAGDVRVVSVFPGSDGVLGSVFSAGGAAGSLVSGPSSDVSSSLEQAMASIRVRDNVINQQGFMMGST